LPEVILGVSGALAPAARDTLRLCALYWGTRPEAGQHRRATLTL
jgi:hypothetical protein